MKLISFEVSSDGISIQTKVPVTCNVYICIFLCITYQARGDLRSHFTADPWSNLLRLSRFGTPVRSELGAAILLICWCH